MTDIASTAVVDHHAELDQDVKVGPYAIIGPHVRIGAGTTIGSHAILDGYTELGRDVRIFPHAVVGTEPQDLKFQGGETWLRIGDRTTIREFATLNPATLEGNETRVGSDCLLMAYSHVAHDCLLGDHVILANAVNLAGHVTVGDYAIIGGMTPVHQFVHVGAHCIIGGGSRIPQDVAPYCRVAGNPPHAFGINVVGLERRGYSEQTIKSLKQAYRILFRSKLGVEEAEARVLREVPPVPEVDAMISFINSSERGVTR